MLSSSLLPPPHPAPHPWHSSALAYSCPPPAPSTLATRLPRYMCVPATVPGPGRGRYREHRLEVGGNPTTVVGGFHCIIGNLFTNFQHCLLEEELRLGNLEEVVKEVVPFWH
eukprot:3370596-Rhodomonas_salina.3